MADIEALQQLRLIETEVDTKRDDSIPESIQKTVGADIIYRNTAQILPILAGRDDYEQIVLELTNLIHSYARVDWWRNIEAKRQMRSHLDDYLYDEIKNKRNINITYEDIDRSINEIIELAENNHNTFGGNE